MKIIFVCCTALLFSFLHLAKAQQGPTTAKPAKIASKKVAPKNITPKPKLNASTKPAAGHKPLKIEVGLSGTTTNFAACAIVTLKNATLDFWPNNSENLDNPKKIKKQFVRVELDILSNCDEAYTYNFIQFHMKISDGSMAMTSLHLNAKNVPDQKTETLILGKGATMTTALYFEVPETETQNSLALIVNGYDEKGLSTSIELKLGK